MLMLPETFPQQPPRAIALHRAADFFARDDAQFWLRAFRQFLPVGDQTTEREPLPLLPDARKLSAPLDARGAAQTLRQCGGVRHAKSNRRQAFAAEAATVAQNRLAAFARIAVEKSMLAFAADFRRLILAFHKFNCLRLGAKFRLSERERLSVNRLVSRRGWPLKGAIDFACHNGDNG
jgi:hypothetical protein